MRAMLLVMVLVGCSPRPCAETCQGCCDRLDVCRPGTSAGWCGVEGRACNYCEGGSCSTTGVCVPDSTGGGQGGGAGGGAGGGGGGGEPLITLRFRYNAHTCCSAGVCVCTDCQLRTCELTKQMTESTFNQRRAAEWPNCALDRFDGGVDLNCSGNCTTTVTSCSPNGMTMEDRSITCQPVSGVTQPACGWSP